MPVKQWNNPLVHVEQILYPCNKNYFLGTLLNSRDKIHTSLKIIVKKARQRGKLLLLMIIIIILAITAIEQKTNLRYVTLLYQNKQRLVFYKQLCSFIRYIKVNP